MAATERPHAPTAKARRRRLFPYFRHAVLIAWSLIVLFPIFWMVSTSFKGSGEWVAWPPHWLPHQPTLYNYQQILAVGPLAAAPSREATEQVYNIWKAVGDSVAIATFSSLVALLMGTFLAYSISRFSVGGKNFRYLVLTIRMVPPIVIAIPILMYYAVLMPYTTDLLLGVRVSLFDTYVGLGLLYVATTLPFVIWMMLSFIDEVPYTLEHAARIMGAGRIYTLRRVVLPLVASGMMVTFLFIFILNWSEFLFALVLTYTNVETIPVKLSKYFSATSGQQYGIQAALACVSIVPLVIVGFFIQRHLVRGLTLGAIKR